MDSKLQIPKSEGLDSKLQNSQMFEAPVEEWLHEQEVFTADLETWEVN